MNNTKYEKRISDLEDKLRELKSLPDNFYELYKQEQARAEDYKAKLRELVDATEWREEVSEARRYCHWRREDYYSTDKRWHRWNESLWHSIQLLDEAEAAYQAALKAAKEG